MASKRRLAKAKYDLIQHKLAKLARWNTERLQTYEKRGHTFLYYSLSLSQ